MNIIIRPVRQNDLPNVVTLLNREIVHATTIFRLVPFDDVATQRWWNAHGEGRFQAVVAEADTGEFAGWAALSPHSAYEAYDRTAELSVWVEARLRGRGVGKQLVDTLQRACPKRSIRTLISRIEATNVSSIGLHRSCGFIEAGTLRDVGEKFGKSLDVVLMQWFAPHDART